MCLRDEPPAPPDTPPVVELPPTNLPPQRDNPMRKLLTGLGALLTFLTVRIFADYGSGVENMGIYLASFCSAAALSIIVGEWANHKS